MSLVYCPECGAVYVEGTRSCRMPCCVGSHEWGPRPLEPLYILGPGVQPGAATVAYHECSRVVPTQEDATTARCPHCGHVNEL